jgi:hypothetical protein
MRLQGRRPKWEPACGIRGLKPGSRLWPQRHMECIMAKMSGPVFVTRVDEVEPLILSGADGIVAGDAVRHHAEGPCLVLARLGDHLMVEAEAAPAEYPEAGSRSA